MRPAEVSFVCYYKFMQNAPEFYAKDRAAWREWLMHHHDTEIAVWLIYDKGVGRKLQWTDVVQEALCFGWIDGRAGKVSETQSKIYVSKRKPKGVWSKINKAHIENLIANDQMMPAGLAAIKLAKENGAWDTLNNSDNFIFPPELETQFKKYPTARTNFEAFSPSSKRLILQWIYDAKTDATRHNRVTQTVESAQRGEKVR
jgi:uncharacterized protein YdeI (YjbR/CyaY-like superfamily)